MSDPVRPTASGHGARLANLLDTTTRLLTATAARLVAPLRWFVVAPVVAALLLIASAVNAPDLPWAVVVAVIGVVPAGWLARRRRDLLRATSDPTRTAEALRSLLSVPELVDRLKANLTRLPSKQAARPGRLGRRLWQGIRLGTALRSQLTDNPWLRSFSPGRLRTTGLLAAACAVSTVVLLALAGLEVLARAVSSL